MMPYNISITQSAKSPNALPNNPDTDGWIIEIDIQIAHWQSTTVGTNDRKQTSMEIGLVVLPVMRHEEHEKVKQITERRSTNKIERNILKNVEIDEKDTNSCSFVVNFYS